MSWRAGPGRFQSPAYGPRVRFAFVLPVLDRRRGYKLVRAAKRPRERGGPRRVAPVPARRNGTGRADVGAIRAVGAHLLFLPPYRPHLNLIKKAFAMIKHRLQNAAARYRDTFRRAVGEVLDDIEPQECANDLRNAGCVSNKPGHAPISTGTDMVGQSLAPMRFLPKAMKASSVDSCLRGLSPIVPSR